MGARHPGAGTHVAPQVGRLAGAIHLPASLCGVAVAQGRRKALPYYKERKPWITV